jgi:hypothetical protein
MSFNTGSCISLWKQTFENHFSYTHFFVEYEITSWRRAISTQTLPYDSRTCRTSTFIGWHSSRVRTTAWRQYLQVFTVSFRPSSQILVHYLKISHHRFLPYMRAVCKVRGLAAVHLSYAKGGGGCYAKS